MTDTIKKYLSVIEFDNHIGINAEDLAKWLDGRVGFILASPIDTTRTRLKFVPRENFDTHLDQLYAAARSTKMEETVQPSERDRALLEWMDIATNTLLTYLVIHSDDAQILSRRMARAFTLIYYGEHDEEETTTNEEAPDKQ